MRLRYLKLLTSTIQEVHGLRSDVLWVQGGVEGWYGGQRVLNSLQQKQEEGCHEDSKFSSWGKRYHEDLNPKKLQISDINYGCLDGQGPSTVPHFMLARKPKVSVPISVTGDEFLELAIPDAFGVTDPCFFLG